MGHQNKISEPCDLLDKNGYLINPGYAIKPYWRYDRSQIKASRLRIKEWDYYYVLAPDQGYGITFTISDLGYLGLSAICWLDFRKKTSTQVESLALLPLGRTRLPATSDAGTTAFHDKKLQLSFEVTRGARLLSFSAPDFVDGQGERGLSGKIVLSQPSDLESMVIATSWAQNRKAFYYNRKINCMPAEGQVTIGTRTYDFAPASSFGGLDWGRGNWTYQNRWYWSSASGMLNGDSFGWNLGYGFSDRSVASENMLFYRGKAHKLEEVTFHIDTNDYLKPWLFSSNDGRFEMSFKPLLDRQSAIDLKVIKSIQHQVFGYFTGKVVLDEGTVLEVRNFLGFAEDVLNWW